MNSPPILEPIVVRIESDVHWGYDLGFDPWPQVLEWNSLWNVDWCRYVFWTTSGCPAFRSTLFGLRGMLPMGTSRKSAKASR